MVYDEHASRQEGAGDWPPVSVIVPMRDEERHIEGCLAALLGQDYPGELELICVDGGSEDATRERVRAVATRDPRVRLLDNPGRSAPAAMNVGAAAARHGLVLRMDAHAVPAPDYVRESVAAMRETGAVCVGGRWVIEEEGLVPGAIAAALAAPFGTGGAAWRRRREPGEVDTVPYGLWPREELLAAGGFDEGLLRNEDYELAWRLRERGGRIWYTPKVVARYTPRRTVGALARQYFHYGLWKPRVARLQPRSLRPRHLIAPAFVLGLVVGAALGLALGGLWLTAWWVGLAAWLAGAVVSAVVAAARSRWRYLPLLPPLFLVLHVAWGVGFWLGLAWRRPPRGAGDGSRTRL